MRAIKTTGSHLANNAAAISGPDVLAVTMQFENRLARFIIAHCALELGLIGWEKKKKLALTPSAAK